MRKRKCLFAAAVVAVAGGVAAAAPVTYNDTHGDQVGSSNAARDLWSATFSNDDTNLTITIDLNSAANLGPGGSFNYGVGITSGPSANGDTQADTTYHGDAYKDDISIDPSLGGMTDWLGIFALSSGSSYTSGFNTYVFSGTPSSPVWTQTQNVATYAAAVAQGDSLTSQSGTSTNNQITVVVPLADFTNLTLTPGSTFNFDIYSTGTSGSNTAYDSLADPSPTQSGTFNNSTQFNDTSSSGGLLTYTVQAVPEPGTSALLLLGVAGAVRRHRA